MALLEKREIGIKWFEKRLREKHEAVSSIPIQELCVRHLPQTEEIAIKFKLQKKKLREISLEARHFENPSYYPTLEKHIAAFLREPSEDE